MVKTFFYITFFIFLAVNFSLRLQQAGEIDSRKTELSSLRSEILRLESDLLEKTKSERESFAVIDIFNRQNFLINKVIGTLRSEERDKDKLISQYEKQIVEIENTIDQLKENYARYIVTMYKHGTDYELNFLLNAESFNQAFLRYQYLKRFSVQRQKDIDKLQNTITELSKIKENVVIEKKEKQNLVAEKQKEEKSLQQKISERQKILESVKNDRTALQKELNAKKEAEKRIQQIIAGLIEAERIRREREAEMKKVRNEVASKEIQKTDQGLREEDIPLTDVVTLSTESLASFSGLRGKMGWPVERGKIIKSYGENRNVRLNTVTVNYGIDILTTQQTPVKAVAEGIISTIDWIPGYGSVMIISHKGGFRTVYGHLAQINVNEGDKVSRGEVIATVGETLEGHILHFEIWNERNSQNPETWLAKR